MLLRFGIILLLMIGNIYADGIEIIEFKDKQLEQRYHVLIQELRCLVCQNQPLADSSAGLAKDMRAVVYEMINEGKTNDEIVQFMVDRYGNFVRYEPPFNIATAVLWIMPFAIVLLLILCLPKFIRRQQKPTLSLDERQQAKKYLE